MKTLIQNQNNAVIVTIKEKSIGRKEVHLLENLFGELAEGSELVLDMEMVQQVIPEFFLLLLRTRKNNRAAVTLASVARQIRIIMEVARLYELFPVAPSVSCCLEHTAEGVLYGSSN